MLTSSVLLFIWMCCGVKTDESSEEVSGQYALESASDEKSLKNENNYRSLQIGVGINDDSDEVLHRKNDEYDNYSKTRVHKVKAVPSSTSGGQPQLDTPSKYLKLNGIKEKLSSSSVENTEVRSQGGTSLDQLLLKDYHDEGTPKLTRKDDIRDRNLEAIRDHRNQDLSQSKTNTLDITTQTPSQSGVGTDNVKYTMINQNRKIVSKVIGKTSDKSPGQRHLPFIGEKMLFMESDSQKDNSETQDHGQNVPITQKTKFSGSTLNERKYKKKLSFIKILPKLNEAALKINKLNKRIVNDKPGDIRRINSITLQSVDGLTTSNVSLEHIQQKVSPTNQDVNGNPEGTIFAPNKEVEKTANIDKFSKEVTTGDSGISGKVLSNKQLKTDPLDFHDKRPMNIVNLKLYPSNIETKISKNTSRQRKAKDGANNLRDIVKSKYGLHLTQSKIKWTIEPFLDVVRNYTSPHTYNSNVSKNERHNLNDMRDLSKYIGKDRISIKDASEVIQPERMKGPDIVLPEYINRRLFSFFNPNKRERLTLGSKQSILPIFTLIKSQINRPTTIRKNDIHNTEVPSEIIENSRIQSKFDNDNHVVNVEKADNIGSNISDKRRNLVIQDSKVKSIEKVKQLKYPKGSNIRNTTKHTHLSRSSKSDWTIQTTKSSYLISVPSSITRKVTNNVNTKTDTDDNTSIPQSLSRLHERLQSAWRKRKRTYVSEMGREHDEVKIDRLSLDAKLVAKTNKSMITLDIPDTNMSNITNTLSHSGEAYRFNVTKGNKSGQHTVKQNDAGNKTSSAKTFGLNEKQSSDLKPTVSGSENIGEINVSFNSISENVKRKINKDERYKLPTVLPYLIRTDNWKSKNVKNFLQEVTKPLKKITKNNTSDNFRTPSIRGENKHLFIKKINKNEKPSRIPFIIKSNKIPMRNEKQHAEVVRDTVSNNLNTMMISHHRRPLTRSAINMNNQFQTTNQVRMPSGLFNRVGLNSASAIPIIRTEFRDTRPFTSNSELISPNQFQQMQRAMNAIRSRRPNASPSVRNRNQNRQFFRQMPRTIRTSFSHNQRFPNNFVQNPPNTFHRQMVWRSNNQNIRRNFPLINTRTPFFGRSFDRNFVISNPRFVQQSSIRSRPPI